MIQCFLPMIPPTITAQEKGINFSARKVYTKSEVKDAENKFAAHLAAFIPDQPLDGPLKLQVIWSFPITGKHFDGEWKTTRPDTDNLIKLLKDVLSRLRFWKDDAQIALEISEKHYADLPGIFIRISELN